MAFNEKKRCLFFGLPISFTTYNITDELISVTSGLFHKVENDAYMYKIVDVRLDTSFLERIFGLGTIHCYGGDVTSPDLVIAHVKHSKEIKDYIFRQSESERLKRRTLHTMNIDGGAGAVEMAGDGR
ncbi:MAG: PH domain-containing protein [Blautia sp.]|nr:PH domain-containing protein [Blautia sp.]